MGDLENLHKLEQFSEAEYLMGGFSLNFVIAA